MTAKLAIILTFSALLVTGCTESQKDQKPPARQLQIDTPAGMIEYLDSLHLPALESVETWQNDFGPGLKLTTDHYEIYTTLLEPLMLSRVPGFVESAFRAYSRQLPDRIEPSTKFSVYLFATRRQWEQFTNSFADYLAPVYKKIKAGAYYLNGSCVAYNIGRERTFTVLAHEGWHQFNSRIFRYRLPSWLDEGVAMLFETSRYDKGFFYFEPGRNIHRLGGLKKTLTNNKMIPLAKLLSINPGEVITDESGDAVIAFYSQAYALVRFLREDNYGRRLGKYHQMLLGGLKGTWPLDAAGRRVAIDRNIPRTVAWNRAVGTLLFREYIDPDLQKIEAEYKAFCKKITYHVRLR